MQHHRVWSIVGSRNKLRVLAIIGVVIVAGLIIAMAFLKK